MKLLLVMLSSLLCFAGAETCFALQPDEILLIVNRNNPSSIELAEYYRDKRQIPLANLLTVNMPDEEDCSREEYQRELLEPLREYFAQRQGTKIRCLLLFYGIPLRVAAPELSQPQWRELEDLKHIRKQINWQLENRQLTKEQIQEREQKSKQLEAQINKLRLTDQRAAVDSEISLALNETYPLDKWQPNPFFVGFQKQRDKLSFNKDQVLFVSRLDGPTPAIVRRMIDDSLHAEKNGLQGQAYFDARWSLTEKKKLKGYALYDASIHKAAAITEKLSSLPVSLDQQECLFQPGEAPQSALYCGWYSLGKYVDAFDWQRGAIGYHIASSECTTLKKSESQVWCKRMLEEGVAATVGPVAEPYVQGFPLPELFFGFLLDGYYTLAESYFLSMPYLSWQMVLIGDPLYRPFRNVTAAK
ncbi:MAG: TIGR03790 family protein [Thermodesulfobacteriota bacterium]|nr:TIGR03790 family protein [Thermodesulfobacteriota bacterium]